ncbi:MAG: hypothetical protein LBM87_03680 [Ruminococcus sp.]|jgi:transglutaminase/protease-like cytokinesis protein 3|nr:hypothetical protein [Ruminococcus sp.]
MIKKRLTAIVAALLMVFAIAGCNKETETASTDALVPNVITSTDTSATTTPAITDANGQTYSSVETLSSEELQSQINDVMTASFTSATEVLKQEEGVRESKDRYAYNTLTDDEKLLYDLIVQQAETLSIKVANAEILVPKETWDKVYCMVYNQEPQLFWLSPKLQRVGRLYYRTSDPEMIKSMQAEIDTTVNKLLAEMNGMSDYEKLDYINTYLSLNSTFQLGHETEDQILYNSTIYNAFAGGTSEQGDIQCVGYAHAVQYLCDRIGINSMVITGVTSTGESHAWNVLSVDGQWYNYDVTWDDPIFEIPNYKNVRHMYMLVPDSWILDKTHFSQNMKFYSTGESFKFFDVPQCTSTDMNWFKQEGMIFSDSTAAVSELTKQLDNAAANGLRTTEIMCADKTVYDKVRTELSTMQNSLKSKYSNVKGLSDKCNEAMLVVELDVIYN